jgi:hypothetical protein
MFDNKAIGEKVLVGVITAIIMTVLLFVWNWTSKGDLVRALGGYTVEEANAKFLNYETGTKNSNEMNTKQIEELKAEIAALRSGLQGSSGAAAGEVSSGSTVATMDQLHKKYQSAECPKGQYVAAVKAWGANSGGGVGDLTGVQIFCRSALP